MLIFGKTLIVLVDAQELRRVAFTNLFTTLLSGKNALLLDFSSVETLEAAQIFAAQMRNTPPLFILNAGALRLEDPKLARDIAHLRQMMPKCFVLVIVDAGWNGEIDIAVSLAVNGVVSMSMPPRDVIAAVEIALLGGTYFPKVSSFAAEQRDPVPPITEDAVSPEQTALPIGGAVAFEKGELLGTEFEEKLPDEPQKGSPGQEAMNLSRRQVEVLKTLQSGLSNKEIARSLGLSEATIKIHVSHLMRKFGVVNRTQVAVMSRQDGMLGKTANPVIRNAPSF